MKFSTKPVRNYPSHLRHVATLPWEIKNSNFLQMRKTTQTDCIFKSPITLLFTHKFRYFRCLKQRVFLHTDCKYNSPRHCPFVYLLLPSIYARTEENVVTANDLVLSQEDKPQTHRTVREISRETGIHRSSASQIICKHMHLKCFKRCRARELTDANCAARKKRAKLLLQTFLQSARLCFLLIVTIIVTIN